MPSETFLFTTVIAWIKYNQEDRLSQAPRVLGKVRLALVDIMVVLEELECEEFQEVPECFSLMYKCLLQHVRPFLFSPFAEEKGVPRVDSKVSAISHFLCMLFLNRAKVFQGRVGCRRWGRGGEYLCCNKMLAT